MKSRSTIFDKNVGSIGNMIASQGPDNVIYFRSKNPTPYNPNTADQQAQRSKFAHIVAVVTAAIVLVRDWFVPTANNHSPYNSAVKSAATSAASETTQTFIQYVRNHMTWVKGALGALSSAWQTNVTHGTGTAYLFPFDGVGATHFGFDLEDFRVHAAAISTADGSILSQASSTYAEDPEVELSVQTADGAQFIAWIEHLPTGKWSNQIKVGYKAAGGTTIA